MMNTGNRSHTARRITALLLAAAAVLILGIAGTASAKAGSQGVMGSTAEGSLFTVRSQGGNAYIELTASEGWAYIEDRDLFDHRVAERHEYDYGFFYVAIYYGSSADYYRWAPSAATGRDTVLTDTTVRFSLPNTGEYSISVFSMDTDTINTYWKHDRFLRWDKDAYWYVSGSQYCTYGGSLYDHGTVTVSCYGNGMYLSGYTVDVYEDQVIYPQEIEGYTIASAAQYVTFSGETGRCDPDSITFYYDRIEITPYVTYETWEDPEPEDFGWQSYSDPDPEPIDFGGLPYLPSAACSLTLKDRSLDYIKPQCGPGSQYKRFASKNGKKQLYAPRDITYLNACFCTGDWVYVEFGYTDGVVRYGFFKKSLFKPASGWDSVPEYSLSYEQAGTVTQSVVPYNGPGRYCGDYESCKLSRGDTVQACMECNDWYLCRFYNNHGNKYGYIYLWVPGSAISWY